MVWKEDEHPRKPDGKFAGEGDTGESPKKFLTAGESIKAGKSHSQWTGAISDAFVNEEIDDDHPAWKSILHGNSPTITQYREAQSVFGQHVRSMHGNAMGKVTGLSDDATAAIVTDADGNESIHDPASLHHLGADVTRRLQSAGHLSVKRHAEYLGKVLAKEAIENDENIGVTMNRHGIAPTATEIRAAIAENVDRMKTEREKYARNRVASGQLGFGFKEDTGQKSFKWREELHPRAEDGKFSTEENKGEKAEEPGNQAKASEPDEDEAEPAFDPMQAVKVSADSIDRLRKQDVQRVIEWTPEEHRDAVAEFITKERPDLAEEVSDVVGELKGEEETPEAQEEAPAEETATGRKETYINGDRVEYTGNMVDGMHEYEFMEGRRKGETGATARGPDGSDPYADRNRQAWKEQQAQFSKLHEKPEPAATEPTQEAEDEKPQKPKSKANASVSDFGDKIEVRKDAAKSNGPRRAKKDDERPGWARRYAVRQVAKSSDKSEEGKWALYDTKITDRWGNEKSHGVFDTQEEAESAVPQVEVNRNHRIYKISDGEYVDKAAGEAWAAQKRAHIADPENNPEPTWEKPERIGEEYGIVRVVSDKKKPTVKGGFKTREEAAQHLKDNPESIIEHKFPRYETYAFLDHVDRNGPKVRDADVSVEKGNNDFQTTFNFRGGVFGNWQTNKDGQTSLNHAYDALHDLTAALGLPPKAAALDGTLAIGFGADGTGGVNSARAHYDDDKKLINLTKMSGAGSLAHEWAHALDWYIGSGNNDFSNPKYNSKMRPELAAAAKELRNVMNSKSIEEEVVAPETSHDADEVAQERKKYPNVPEDQFRIVSPRTVQGNLHNITQDMKSARRWKGQTNKKMAAPIPEEDQKEWDSLVKKIGSGDVGDKTYKGMRTTYTNVENLNALHKKLTGRAFHTGDWQSPSAGHYLVSRIEDRKSKEQRVREASEGVKTTRKVQSDFLKSASKLDDTRSTDYYSTPHEMFARAFEAYVADKLKGKDVRSDYLVSHKKTENHAYEKFGMSPFPAGEEREKINKAFDNLFATLKQEQRSDDKGEHVRMYSMRGHESTHKPALSLAERIADRLRYALTGDVDRYAKTKSAPGQLGFGFVAKGGQHSIKWDESKHPRAEDGKFSTEQGAGVENEAEADEAKLIDDKSEVADQDEPGEDAKDEAANTGDDLASKAEEAFAEDVEEESPRAEATKQVEADAKSEQVYAFARESAIPNMGEDVLGSARHKRNQWKGLEEAEKDGTAEEMVTRDNLLKNEPHGLAIHADRNPMTAMAMHYAIRSIPEKPGYKNGTVGPKEREQYLDLYRTLKEKAQELAENEPDPRKAISSLWNDLAVKARELRGQSSPTMPYTGTDRHNQTASLISSMSTAFETFRSRPKLNTILGKTMAFVAQAAKAVPEMMDKSLDHEERAAAFRLVGTAAIAIMSGKSVPQAFGTKSTRAKAGFSELAQYVSSAERKGGKDVSQHTTSGEKAAKHLGENYGLRGVQWGNSLTDEERKHHAVKTVEAFTDLADVLGLKPEDVSLGGHVALGVGSRGKGGTAATYWPDKKFINLNRSSGVGTLAHEWGHAFDHSLADFSRSGMGFEDFSRSHNGTYSSPEHRDYHPAMKGLREAMESSGYKKRLIGELQKSVNRGDISATKANKYWLNDAEMFARSFERHVQDKLEGRGQKNTYLAGLSSGGGLWPTPEETAHMAPHFDKLFAAFRKKKYGSEEPQKFSRLALMEAVRMALTGPVDKYRQQYDPNEEGHWVTIDGHHVFIKDSTAGEHAKAMGQLHRVKAEHVQHLMPEAHNFLKGQIDQREVAKAHARKLSRLNSGSIAKIENNYRDWSSVDGFDTIARDVAIAHPELGLDPDDTDTPGKVWELIREGKEAYPSAESKEVAELAAKWLRSAKPAKAKEYHPEDALEFSRKGEVYRPAKSVAERVVERLRYSLRAERYSFSEADHPRGDNGQFTEKDGDDSGRVKMRQAKAGGEVSEVDGQHYKGGRWMPVHGLYSGQEKPEKKPKQEVDRGPVFANPNGRGAPTARQLSPEQVEGKRERQKEQQEWDTIQSGPLGQLLRLGDRPHNIRHTHGDIRKWAEMFESGDITTDSLEDVTDFARDQVKQIEEAKSAMTPEDWEYYSGWVDENAARDRSDYAPRQIKKLLNANPAITNARSWVATLIESRQDIDTLKELNKRLTSNR